MGAWILRTVIPRPDLGFLLQIDDPRMATHYNRARDATIEDCRKRFRPLTNQKTCCTFLIGDGVSSFGDFNATEPVGGHGL